MGLEENEQLSFKEAIAAIKQQALRLIKERFEKDPYDVDTLDFHNTRHTEGVIRRTEAILNAIRNVDTQVVSEKDILLGGLAAAWHDTVQKYHVEEVSDGSNTKKIRRRHTIENEHASAEEAIVHMAEICKKRGTPSLFTEDDEAVIREAIDVTIPGFDLERKTVIQPHLKPESHVVTRAVALADIGTSGMEDLDAFLQDGDAVFREENIDIREVLKNKEMISDAQKEFFRQRMIAWNEGQKKFVEGRKALLDTELKGLSDVTKAAVQQLFKRFDENIEGMKEKITQRKDMSFEELTKDMGY